MKSQCGVYPALGRFFDSVEDLAHAGCMSPKRCFECIAGREAFTDDEKKAITNEIIARMIAREIPREKKILKLLFKARYDFDEVFRSEVAA